MWEQLIVQYKAGGFFMHLILLCSALGVAIAIERFKVLFMASYVKKDDILNQLNAHILRGHVSGALNAMTQIKHPITNVVKAGLTAAINSGGNSEEVQTAMDAVALREVPRLEKRIELLATLSNIATLLGLLGTVAGLISAFGAAASLPPAQRATELASAIATAMNTTAFGLIVAIPLLGCYGYLQSLASEVVDDIHEVSVSALNFILIHKDKLKIQPRP